MHREPVSDGGGSEGSAELLGAGVVGTGEVRASHPAISTPASRKNAQAD